MGKDIADLGVLVVDDEGSVTRLLRMMLNDLGVAQVFTAADGRVALNILGDFEDVIDVIISDWNMPGVSGLNLLWEIRTVNPALPFFMLTGRGDVGSMKVARDGGITGYMLKPFSAEDLEAKLLTVAKRLDHRVGA